MNQATLTGNLGQDPEGRSTAGGTFVSNFSLATSRRVKKGEQWEDETEWHRCVAFGAMAENLVKYQRKGMKLLVQGRLQTRKWQDKDGVERSTTEIVADIIEWLSPPKEGGTGGGGGKPTTKSGNDNQYAKNGADDDIPFS